VEIKKVTEVINTVPFSLEKVDLYDPIKQEEPHPYHRLSCKDWVNVVPVTASGQVVLIKQYRVGNDRQTLETPGGVMDPGERDPTAAALRELEEETGLTSQRILPLASINPNPAIMTNRLHMFIALGCTPASNRKHFPDHFENIEVILTDKSRLDELIRLGQVDSCLASLALMLAGKYL
jgi:ADP-ribose pyrophosphatase